MKLYILFLTLFCLTLTGCLKNSSDEEILSSQNTNKTGSLFGKIFDTDNTPSSNVIVYARPIVSVSQAAPQKAETVSTYTSVTNSDGYYAINNIPEGMYMIIAEKSDHLKATKMNVSVKQNTVTDLGQIDITPTGSISGTVTTHGSTTANVKVAILGSSYYSITNSSGVYNFSNIPQGTYTVTAMLLVTDLKGYVMSSKQVTVSGGATSSVDTIELSNTFYIVSGPNEMQDLTDNGTGFDPSSMSFDLYFSHPPKSADIVKNAISISPNDKSYNISVSLSENQATVTFSPSAGFSQEFKYNTGYTISVGTTLTDINDTPLSLAYSFSFTTKAPATSYINKVTPTDLSEMCPDSSSWSSPIMIYFSSLMDRASIEENTTIKNSSGTAVKPDFQWTSDNANDLDILSIKPYNDTKNVYAPTHLAENETYTVNVSGKTFSQTSITAYSFTFKTHLEGEYITSDTTWSSDKTIKVPVYITSGVTLTISAGVKITLDGYSSLNGAINDHARNYPSENTNTVPGTLNATGSSSSHITFNGKSLSSNYINVGKGSTLSYCDIDKCTIGTDASGSASTDIYTINHCSLTGSMISVNDTTSSAATSSIYNNTFRYALSTNAAAINIQNNTSQVTIYSNDIQDNYYGIYTGATLDDMNIKISSNNIYNNTYKNLYFSSGATEEIHITANYFGTTTNSTLVVQNYLTTSNFLGFDSDWVTSSVVNETGQ